MDDNLKDMIYKFRDELIIFHLLTDEELEQILPYLEVVHYPAGTVIFKEGDTGDFMGFVDSGKLEVKKDTEFKGKQIILALLSKGSFVGELSMIDEKPRSATVVSLEDSKLIILKSEAMDFLIQKHPYAGIKILKGISRILATRLRKAGERLSLIF
ncbi:MAG: cyclic nucleotide-binding domain-containing protein [Candidatus Mariimomonas ferrooxydans]